MIRLIILLVLATFPAHAQTVSGEQISTKVSVIFYVTEGTNSPYQGLLTYSVPEFQALTPIQRRVQEIQQYLAWRAVRDAPRPPITKDDLIQMMLQKRAERDRLQSEADQLQAEIDGMP